MKTIAVVTVGRSDWGNYRPILHRIAGHSELDLRLVVSGAHLVAEFGLTVNLIQKDGFEVGDRVDMLLASDTPAAIAKSMGLGVVGFADVWARARPDLLLVFGDRFEMYAAAAAALPFGIPVAHVHGGELTEGAFDDALRHSITKLSHLHFVATEEYGRRVRQLGEEPWRVTVTGAPGLDNIVQLERLPRATLADRFGLSLDAPFLLVTFHPVTLEYRATEWQVGQLLTALAKLRLPVVFTPPNADTEGRTITRAIEAFVRTHPFAQIAPWLGTQGYLSLMGEAEVMVGNSSSGIVEAASFGLPVVNVGSRQAGRLHAVNVIDAEDMADDVAAAIVRALRPEFRAALQGLVNPYGDGHAAERIVQRLADVVLDRRLLVKRFVDWSEHLA